MKSNKNIYKIGLALAMGGVFAVTAGNQASAATITVKSGDTLYSIAKANNVTVAQMQKINSLTGNSIYVGQKLETTEKTVISKENKTITVKSGDTLYSIAKANGMTVTQIQELNRLKNNTLYVGQKLKVNGESKEVEKVSNDTATTESKTITVRSGDTLYSIAKANGMTVTQIQELNGLKNNTLYVGQKLKVSGVKEEVTVLVEKETVKEEANKEELLRENIIKEAKKYMGIKYLWGGATPSGFDCSGYVSYVYQKQGLMTQRYTTDGFLLKSKAINEPKIGDIVFFKNTYKLGVSHMGIYVGDGKMIHASTSRGIVIDTFKTGYWKTYFMGYGTMIK